MALIIIAVSSYVPWSHFRVTSEGLDRTTLLLPYPLTAHILHNKAFRDIWSKYSKLITVTNQVWLLFLIFFKKHCIVHSIRIKIKAKFIHFSWNFSLQLIQSFTSLFVSFHLNFLLHKQLNFNWEILHFLLPFRVH